jgi:hypothetical protein
MSRVVNRSDQSGRDIMFDEKFATISDELIAIDGRGTQSVIPDGQYEQYREKIEEITDKFKEFGLLPLFRSDSDFQRFAEIFAVHDLDFYEFNREIIDRTHHHASEKHLNNFGLGYLTLPVPPQTIYITSHPSRFASCGWFGNIEEHLVYLQDNAFGELTKVGWIVKLAVTEEFGYEVKTAVAHTYWLQQSYINESVRVALLNLSSRIGNGRDPSSIKVTVTNAHRDGFNEALVAVRKRQQEL